jgi:nicotinamidase/pyrazinamidase
MKIALLAIDVQKDFCPSGALAVPDGDKIVPVLNEYIEICNAQNYPVFASRDWHPASSRHFASAGGQWPAHCVQNTDGASFHPDLILPHTALIISKGQSPESNGYSAFEATGPEGKPFEEMLRQGNVDTLLVGGLATDYCVRVSVLEALKRGFRVWLLVDAIGGVNLHPEDSQRAIDEMVSEGAMKMIFPEAEIMLEE